jgi:pantoate--beta-alanine ligase
MITNQVSAGVAIEGALEQARKSLESAGFAIDYLTVRNAETLEPVSDQAIEPLRALAAARLGSTRLIDNVAISQS